MVSLGTKAQLTDGTVYWIQDVGSGQFISQGDDWSTKAVAQDVGGLGFQAVYVSDGVYTLKNIMWNTVKSANVGLGVDVYVDQTPAEWTLTAAEGGYLISTGGNYLANNSAENAYKEKPINKTTDAAVATVWRFLTRSEYDAAIQAYKDSKAATYAANLGYSVSSVSALEAILATDFIGKDYTSSITNPTLGSNWDGWAHGAISQRGEGAGIGSGCAEFWNGCGYATQTVTSLPNGLYKVEFVGTYRPSSNTVAEKLASDDTSSPAFVYANDARTEFIHWIDVPAKANGRSGITKANGYAQSFYTYVSDGTLALGVVADGWIGDNGYIWNPFGQFAITYYSDQVEDDDITALVASIPAVGTIPAAVTTNLNTLQSTLESTKTIAAYNNLTNAVEEAKTLVAPYATYLVAAEDAAIAGVDAAIINAQNEAVASATEETFIEMCISALHKSIAELACYDITDFTIKNPTAQTKDNWEGTDFGTASDNVVEYWGQSGADFHQTLANLPAGSYRLTVIAVQRTNMKGTIYAGEKRTLIAEDGVVNSRSDCALWFNAGNGVNTVYFTLADAADVTIGLTADATTGDHWTVWKGFKLETFTETVAASYMAPGYDDALAAAQAYLTVDMFDTDKSALTDAINDNIVESSTATIAAYETAIANLNAATKAAQAAAAKYTQYNQIVAAIGENTNVDLTSFVANADFQLNNLNGWTSVDGGNVANNGNFNNTYFVERWKNGVALGSGSLTHDAIVLPAGVYQIAADAQNIEQYNGGAAGTGLFLCANAEQAEIGAKGKYEVYIKLADKEALTIQFLQDNCTGNWIAYDNVTLTYVAEDYLYTLADGKMSTAAATAQTDAEAAFLANENTHTYNALLAAIAEAQASIDAYAKVPAVLTAATAILESTNVYTAEAFETFSTAISTAQTAYNENTLSTADANDLERTLNIADWGTTPAPASTPFITSAWTSTNDVLVGNFWSVEGDAEGSSGMKTPFLQYWVADNEKLADNTISATLTGLETGLYSVTAFVRVMNNKTGDDAGYDGISLQVNDGEAVAFADATEYSDGFAKELTAEGLVKDGNLNITFAIAGTNASWLSFKNVKYTKVRDLTPEEAGGTVDPTPEDVTALITNPAYIGGYDGWTYSENGFKSRTYEAPMNLITYSGNAAFEVSQTLKDVPAGLYELSVYAFYRAGSLDDEKAKIAAGTELEKELTMYAAIGEDTYSHKVMNLSEGATETNYNEGAQLENGLYVPNSAADSRAWYIAGAYKNNVKFNVFEAGDVTIGLSKTVGLANDYCPVGAWQLVRLGDADAETATPDEKEEKPELNPGDDATSYITNPSFETGDLTGWTVVASDDTGVKPNSNGTYTTEGCDGDYLFNTWWKGNPITQTVTGLPNGQYELKALMANNAGDGNNDKPCLYLLANGEHSEAFSSATAGVFAEGSMQFYVTNGTVTIGAVGGNADGTFREDGYYWYKADNFRLTYVAALPSVDEIEIPEGKMSNAAATAITAAKEAGNSAALIDAVKAAKASIAAYVNAATAIAAAKAVREGTNVATAEAATTFAAAIEAIESSYNDGSLSDDDAKAAGATLGTIVTGWREGADGAAVKFMESAYGLNGFDAALYINTWSDEGETDGSGFKVPFYEYFTDKANVLGANTFTTTVTGLEPGEYTATALIRVALQNDAEGTPAGVTLDANGGDAVAVDAEAKAYGTLYLKEVTAEGIVDESGVLAININVAAENNVHWLSFKNVKFAKKGAAPTTYAINISAGENGKVESDKAQAAEGETVTITVTPDEGYMVDEVSVTYGEDQPIEWQTLDMETLTGTFLMPAADVNVAFTFKVKEEKEPEVTATLVHTAGASWGSNTGKNTVDTAAEYYNNEASTGWAGVAFAEFDFSNLPNGATITEATLFWNATNLNVNGDRNNYVYYLNADQAVDYEGIATSEKEQLFSGVKTLLENVVAPKGTSNIEGKTTATDALNELIAAGQKKIIFQFTGNGGGANLHGKAAEDAPQLVIKYMPGAPEVPNASFEADGEKKASNGAIEMTGWTFAGVGTQFNNTELRSATTEGSTSQFGTSDPSDGEYSLFFRQGWNNGGNVITITSAALDEIPAGDYTLSIDYKQHYSYDNDDQKNENTKVTIALKNGEDILGSETSPAAAGVKGGSGDATYFNDAEWSTLTASFTIDKAVAAGAQIVITLNSAGARRSDFYLDNVKLTKVPGIELAKAELQKAIDAAQAEAAKYVVGEELFMYPASEIAPLTTAIATATDALNDAEATKESITDATTVLNAAVEAFAPQATQPDAEKLYTFKLRLDGETPLYMNLTADGISIAEEATALKFVTTDAAGQFNLANADETLFVGLAGGNAWTMSTAADKKAAWTFTALGEGAYRINNLVTAGRFVGTNAAEKEAGSPCYADKLTSNGNVDWIIAEYTPTPVGIKSFAIDDKKAAIYDLSGRKVEKIQRGGVYIIDGKKVSVK